MSKKISFPEPSCRYHCPHFKSVGPSLNETHYCMKKGKNGKRFSKKDSKRKPPAWCPLRLNSPICRIYGFRNELQEMLAFDEWLSIDPAKVGWYSPMVPPLPVATGNSSWYDSGAILHRRPGADSRRDPE